MNDEFNTLLAAYSATHNAWCGAMSLHSAVHQHLDSVGHAAAECHLAELRATHAEASAALDAYSQRERKFNVAAYEAQQRATSHLQKAA